MRNTGDPYEPTESSLLGPKELLNLSAPEDLIMVTFRSVQGTRPEGIVIDDYHPLPEG